MDGKSDTRRPRRVQQPERPVSSRPGVVAAVAALALLCAAALPALGQAAAGQTSSGQAAPGQVQWSRPIGSYSAADVRAWQGPLFAGYAEPSPLYTVDAFQVVFPSTDYDGSSAEIVAELFIPRLVAPSQRPVLVFGSGTTGIGDACAPSLELGEVRHFGDYRANMLAYASQGFIVMFPDYLGFNDPSRPQRYFSRLAEGHVMLDAARAVFEFFSHREGGLRPLPKVFVAGYSQGGHAAFAAADLQRSYAPEVPLAGVITFGGTTDVEALLREGPAYAPLIFYTYSVMYGTADVNPSAYLQEKFARTLETDVKSMCIDQFQTYYSYDGTRVYRPDFHKALYAGQLAQLYPSLSRRLAENRAGLSGHGLPALVAEGGTDFIVTPESQKRFVDALREAGSVARYVEFKGVPHKGIRQAAFQESLRWMESLTRGDPAPSS